MPSSLGDQEVAFRWLERGMAARRDMETTYEDPGWPPIRADPRFARLRQRMGMSH